MENTKLVKLLKTFSKGEVVKFGEYISSPYFNKNKNVESLGEEILNFYPDFTAVEFTKEKIYDKIFKGEKFDYFKFKNYISDLYQLAVSYLKLRTVEKREYENEITLLDELHERKLDLIYSQKERKVSDYLRNSMVKDETYYALRHQLGKINTSHFKFRKTGYSFNHIQNEFDTFLDYSLIGLLRLYSKMLHNKNHGNINFNMEMFDNLWEYVKDKEFEGNPSCQIYKQTILLELTRDEAEYRKLLTLKEKYNENIPREDMYYILQFINSFSVYRLKLGDESYYNDRFMSFREMIERDFIPSNNFLFVNFISTFTSACMAGEYKWSEDFLNRYQKGISPKEEKTNTLNYCKAFLAYRLMDFDKALEYFSKTKFKLYLMKVMVKSYSVRIYYEQNMIEQTISAVDTFRHYLKSENLMAEDQKTAHYEFLNLLTELSEIKFEGISKSSEENIELAIRKINKMQSNPLGTKNWLIEKANEMMKSA
ncbi:MAG: hypothetical protein ABI543_05630 [Ignavibacteria bacterium]